MSSRTCPICGKEFKTVGGMKYHHNRIHGYSLPRGYRFECEGCGKEFRSYDKDARFCSAECYYPNRALSPQESAQEKFECLNCGVSFWQYRSNSADREPKYCSPDCYHQSTRGKPGNKNGKALDCEICGKGFYVPKVRLKTARFCSRDCLYESRRRLTGEEHPLYSRVARECEWCGDTFTAKPAKIEIGEGRFCSRQCVGAYTTAKQHTEGTSIEVAVRGVLEEMGVRYEEQARVGKWCADFYLPEHNLVIECDGVYWHSLPEVIEKDKRKDAWMAENGYLIAHLSGDEIRADAEGAVDRALQLARIR